MLRKPSLVVCGVEPSLEGPRLPGFGHVGLTALRSLLVLRLGRFSFLHLQQLPPLALSSSHASPNSSTEPLLPGWLWFGTVGGRGSGGTSTAPLRQARRPSCWMIFAGCLLGCPETCWASVIECCS